ncbi:MAG: hypothetical protein HY513_00555 [Candidatus Aenigmarchaeota archaeon]|nr:hypothetical protein [Candidatus Aenigmarchaeota archaeon]
MPVPFLDPSLTPFFTTFLFVFAVVYGALGTAGVFKEKGVNIIIALAFALFAATYPPLVSALQQFLPIAAGIIVVLFFFLLIKKVFSGKKNEGQQAQLFDSLPLAIGLGIGLLLVGILLPDFANYLPHGLSLENALWLIAVIVVLALFLAFYRHKEPKE